MNKRPNTLVLPEEKRQHVRKTLERQLAVDESVDEGTNAAACNDDSGYDTGCDTGYDIVEFPIIRPYPPIKSFVEPISQPMVAVHLPITHPGLFPLGSNRFITASMFSGEKKVHIRQYQDLWGKLYPSKHGIAMPLKRFASFAFNLMQINEKVESMERGETVDFKLHIGGGVYVTINNKFKTVDIRKFFMPPDSMEEKPTRRGISLRLAEWKQLVICMPKIIDSDIDIGTALPCYLCDSHKNMMAIIECRECSPFETSSIDE